MTTRTILLLASCVAMAACDGSSDPGAGATDGATDGGTDGAGTTSGGTDGQATTWASSWGTTGDTTPWNIDTEDPPDTPTTATPTGGGDEDGDVDGDEETEGFDSEGGKDEENFVGWFGFGAAVPGESYAAMGEVVVFVDGADQCILIWSAQSSEPDEGCAECEFAYRITIGEVEAEVEEDCSLAGTDAQSLPGTIVGLGWNGEELYTDFGDGYSLAEDGFGEYDPKRGQFFWELSLVE
ncbi:MAG: hypothetical protein AAGA54_21670 [Myxococcota bacterium]